ncbi:signal anchor, putative [Medicago truncatula]|uniref:Signal anchor, putative n=3 Tax=Embryophyta TaxID=3193 RepID=A0A072UJ16_MEDTR|nr:signal anchor, putative [Medicago truncatula]
MDWCGSSTPRTPEYRTMNEVKRTPKASALPSYSRDGGQRFWFFHVVKELNNQNRWRLGREPIAVSAVIPERCVLPGPLVLGKGPLNALTPTPDMDRTVSRRSEPSSRTALMGEQPNPWNILQLQVAKSRHRGAKPSRRCDDGPSTRHRRITKVDFRPCSTGGSCSQAPFCLCTRGPISVWPEETFARLRYLLGGLRPIETVYLRLSLGLYWHKVVRIFTDMSISPSLSPRQCPDRYAFRAGRNLPDKEFRYLRTVIVTAAVHRGFGRRLPCHQVTNFLNLPALGRRQPPYMVLRLCGDLCFW